MTGFHKFHVRLFRDSFNTPWGFRLQGGKDLNQALSVQRVFSNTPAEGELQRGDVIISIGERSGDDLTHKQAKDLIEGGGGQISLVLTRPPLGRHDLKGQPQAPTFRTPAPVAPRINPPKAMPYHGGGAPSSGHKPKKLNISRLGGGGPDFGADYSRPHTTMPPQQASRPSYRPVAGQQGGQMLNKVQESLDNIIYTPRTPEAYQAPPFQQQQHQPPPFQANMSMSGYAPTQQQQPPPQQYRPTYEQVDSEFKTVRSTPIPKVPRPVSHHPDAPSFGTDYSKGQAASVKWTPQPQRAPPPQSNQPVLCEQPVYPVQCETMAPWRETLRTTGVKPWDMDLDYGSQQPTPSTQGQAPAPPTQRQAPAPPTQSQAPAPPTQSQAPAPNKPGKDGDRDWNASAVYRMIHSEPRRPGQSQAQAPRAPPPAPKPVAAPAYRAPPPRQQFTSPGYEDELGVSDF